MDQPPVDLVTPTRSVDRALAARAVSVRLGGRAVVDGVTFDVTRGEWLAVIGPNGAGKTSLIRAIAGILHAEGELTVDGCTPGRVSARELARRVAYVPQAPELPTAMSVAEYASLGRTAHLPYFGVESARDHAVVRGVLDLLDLGSLSHRALAELSGGERQRVVLARALAQEATTLLLDEPTASLDIGHQQQVLELVDDLRRSRRLTVVSAIHDLTLASQFADRLLVLSAGRDVAIGPPEEVLTEQLVAEYWNVAVSILSLTDGGVAVSPRRARARRSVDV